MHLILEKASTLLMQTIALLALKQLQDLEFASSLFSSPLVSFMMGFPGGSGAENLPADAGGAG